MDAKQLNALVHDHDAAAYDDRFLIGYDRGIARDVERALRSLLGDAPRAARALDVACGTGYLAVGLAAAGMAEEVHACDISAEMLRATQANAARAGARVHLELADAERLPYADASFDLVVVRGALHHVPDPFAALSEIRRVLAPGAPAIVTAEPTPGGERQVARVVGSAVRAVEAARGALARLPARLRPAFATPRAEHHAWELASMAANLHTFEPPEIAALAEKAGFEEIAVGTASLAWILALGLNYYLVGEIEHLARAPGYRRGARAVAGVAALFDRVVTDRFLPPSWRHTVHAVLR